MYYLRGAVQYLACGICSLDRTDTMGRLQFSAQFSAQRLAFSLLWAVLMRLVIRSALLSLETLPLFTFIVDMDFRKSCVHSIKL